MIRFALRNNFHARLSIKAKYTLWQLLIIWKKGDIKRSFFVSMGKGRDDPPF